MTRPVHSNRSRPTPWRLFRHDGAAATRFPGWSFVALFVASLGLSHACQYLFGAVAVWPANGVLAAGLLLLERRKAIIVLAACVGLNLAFDILIRARGLDTALTFSLLNAAEAIVVALIARRFCGAALQLGRPVRLARFALLAAAPAVVLAALLGLWLIQISPELFNLYFASWVSVELLGCLVVTPAIVILSQRALPQGEHQASLVEGYLLIGGAALFAGAVCLRIIPLPVAAILPALLLIALRLTPRQAAISVVVLAAVTTIGFLYEPSAFEAFAFGVSREGVSAGTDITMRLPSFYVFMAAILVTIYPASTVVSERLRLQRRLELRSARARQDAARLAVAAQLAAQATEAKRRFLNMISHELRTPLGQVAGFASLAAADQSLGDETRDKISKISLANAHALELVDDMIDFARADLSVATQAFDLRDTVRTLLDYTRQNIRNRSLDVRFEDRLGAESHFVGDPRRLRQVLRLLVHNAAKFTEHGHIGIEVEAVETGARLTVFDTGAGFDTAHLPELLEAFRQGDGSLNRAKEGVGIGLALAHRLLRALGGDWVVDSSPGLGARITLTVPMERACQAAGATEPDRAPRLLVVDDHAANREILGLMLRTYGCEVDYAADGEEAVKATRTGAYDIILMDLRMPRMDGYEASRQIRALPGPAANAPILAVSAECRAESEAACRDAGMDDFLAKPVTQAILLETLTTWLDPVSARARLPSRAA